VASAVLRGPELLAQLLFTPLVAALLLIDGQGGRIVSPMLDRERLIAGTR
jgi:hypothetical protein